MADCKAPGADYKNTQAWLDIGNCTRIETSIKNQQAHIVQLNMLIEQYNAAVNAAPTNFSSATIDGNVSDLFTSANIESNTMSAFTANNGVQGQVDAVTSSLNAASSAVSDVEPRGFRPAPEAR